MTCAPPEADSSELASPLAVAPLGVTFTAPEQRVVRYVCAALWVRHDASFEAGFWDTAPVVRAC